MPSCLKEARLESKSLTMTVSEKYRKNKFHEQRASLCPVEAMISFIKTIYTVNEEQGMVVVCAVVENDGPDPIINFPFSVTLSTSPVTATTGIN